jgi:hypothetical protein
MRLRYGRDTGFHCRYATAAKNKTDRVTPGMDAARTTFLEDKQSSVTFKSLAMPCVLDGLLKMRAGGHGSKDEGELASS